MKTRIRSFETYRGFLAVLEERLALEAALARVLRVVQVLGDIVLLQVAQHLLVFRVRLVSYITNHTPSRLQTTPRRRGGGGKCRSPSGSTFHIPPPTSRDHKMTSTLSQRRGRAP